MSLLHAALLATIVPTESWEPPHSSLVAFMANEITTTSLDDMTNASIVVPMVIGALSERPGHAIRACREFNGTKGAKAIKIPKQVAFWGSPNDKGVGVDLEYDGTEGTAASNTAMTDTGVTISHPEYVIAHALTDNVGEDSALDAADLMNLISGTMLKVLTLALDDDFCALAPGLSNSYGTSGSDLTLAQAIAAAHGIVTRGAVFDAIEYLMDPEQVSNIHASVLSTNAAAAVYAPSADRLIGFTNPGAAEKGQGKVATLNGNVVIQSGLTDTANAGADVAGMAYCPTTANNDATGATTFGIAWKRLPFFEQQRQAKGRATDLVMSMRVGVAELQDGSGSNITTDAP